MISVDERNLLYKAPHLSFSTSICRESVRQHLLLRPAPDFNIRKGTAYRKPYAVPVPSPVFTGIVSSPTIALNGEKHAMFCEWLGVSTLMTAVAVLLIGSPDNTVDGVA